MPNSLNIATEVTAADLKSKLPWHLRIALEYRIGGRYSTIIGWLISKEALRQVSASSAILGILGGLSWCTAPGMTIALGVLAFATAVGLNLVRRQVQRWSKCVSETGEASELLAYTRSTGNAERYLVVLSQNQGNLAHCDVLIARALAKHEWRSLSADDAANSRAIWALMEVGFEQFHSYNVAGTLNNIDKCLQSDKSSGMSSC